MLHEKKREEKEDERYQRSQANEEILLGFVRELKESSERKVIQAEKKWATICSTALICVPR